MACGQWLVVSEERKNGRGEGEKSGGARLSQVGGNSDSRPSAAGYKGGTARGPSPTYNLGLEFTKAGARCAPYKFYERFEKTCGPGLYSGEYTAGE